MSGRLSRFQADSQTPLGSVCRAAQTIPSQASGQRSLEYRGRGKLGQESAHLTQMVSTFVATLSVVGNWRAACKMLLLIATPSRAPLWGSQTPNPLPSLRGSE